MSGFAPMPETRPHFWSVEQAQEFQATRFEKITPWLCAQRARAFLFLARHYGILTAIGRQYWKSARAFVALGRRVRAYGPSGAVWFPSDWLRSEKYLVGSDLRYRACLIKEDLFAIEQMSDMRQAFAQLERVITHALRLRPELKLAAEKEARREKSKAANYLPAPRPFVPSRMMVRARKDAAFADVEAVLVMVVIWALCWVSYTVGMLIGGRP